jgi:hypothetical protein
MFSYLEYSRAINKNNIKWTQGKFVTKFSGEEFNLPEYSAVEFVESQPTFRRNISPASS